MLSACGSGQTKADRLKESIFYFNEGVRWGRVQDVMARIDPESVDHFVEMHKEFGAALQVTNYEIINTILSPDENKADVTVQITWYRIDQMEVMKTVLVQHWEHREREWLVISEEYRAGTPF
jgi:hypothetical protein